MKDLAGLANKLDSEDIPTYLEISRRGGHLWFFFDRRYDGEQVRDFGKGILHKYQFGKVEMFPKQDRLHTGPGSLVRLPFGRHRLTGQRYPFIYPDGELLAPTVTEQIRELSTPRTISENKLTAYSHRTTTKNHQLRQPEKKTGSTDIERVKEAMPLIDFIGNFVELRPTGSGALPVPRRPACKFRDKC